MTNGQDRRHTDTEAARRRQEELQHRWDASHAAGPDHITDAFAQALGALIDAACGLPICDRAAKLHAALTQLSHAADRAAACAAARALFTASEQALDHDPWLRFHHAAGDALATVCGG